MSTPGTHEKFTAATMGLRITTWNGELPRLPILVLPLD